jgi:hypothetical protein
MDTDKNTPRWVPRLFQPDDDDILSLLRNPIKPWCVADTWKPGDCFGFFESESEAIAAALERNIAEGHIAPPLH